MGRSVAWSEWRERRVAVVVRSLGIFIEKSGTIGVNMTG